MTCGAPLVLLRRALLAARGSAALSAPDYQLVWYLLVFVAEVAQLVISAMYVATQEANGKPPVDGLLALDIASIVHSILLAVFALPALVDLTSTFQYCSCACLRVETGSAEEYTPLAGGSPKKTASAGAAAGPLYAQAGAGAAATRDASMRSPEELASCCSRAVFWWMNDLIILGWQRPLEQADVPPLGEEDTSFALAGKFMAAWRAQLAAGKAALGGRWLTELPVARGGYADWVPPPDAGEDGKDGKDADADFPKLLPEKGLGNPSLGWTMCVAFGRHGAFGAMLKFTYDVLSISVGPNVLNALISFLQDYADGKETRAWVGYSYVGILAASSLASTIILHQYFLRMFRVGQHLRSAVILATYRKSLRVSTRARQQKSVGQITNLQSTDASRMQNLTSYVNMVWSGPLQIALSMYFLWQQLGAAMLAGVGVMVIFIPLNGVVASIIKRFQKALMRRRDERVNATSEAINGMKIIKLSAWEDHFLAKIGAVRADEIQALTSWAVVQQSSVIMWVGMPLLVSVAAFATYVGLGHELTAAKAFTALSLFNLLRFPLTMLPMSINNLVEATVSVRRIKSFLLAEELDPNATLRLPVDPAGLQKALDGVAPTQPHAARIETVGYQTTSGGEVHVQEPADGVVETDLPLVTPAFSQAVAEARPVLAQHATEHAMGIVQGTYMWQASKPQPAAASTPALEALEPSATAPLTAEDSVGEVMEGGLSPASASRGLRDLTLLVPTGQFLAVVGQVGSGKSSLLSAFLGEMPKTAGTAWIRGSLAYVPQTAFILNDTLQGNILFGRPMNRARYEQVLDVCCLTPDIAILPAGDQCEIGDKGINLSGGQRQRVALARAVYADADVYIFDDPLSAVDAHVGRTIFNKCMLGLLGDRTRVLVTHGLQYTSRADRVVVMADGAIAEDGRHAELAAQPGGRFASLLQQYEQDVEATRGGEAADGVSSDEGEAESEVQSEAHSPPKADPAKPTDRTTDAGSSSTGKLTKAEGRERGRVDWQVYKKYAEAGGGMLALAGVLFMFALSTAGTLVANWWLSYWTDHIDANTSSATNMQYLEVYIGISVGALVVLTILRVCTALFGVRAARTLHDGLLARIFHAKQSFFDTVPVGRILNRFSSDQYKVDEQLAQTCSSLANTSFGVLGTFVVIASVTPWFIAVLVPLLVLYYFIQRYYVATSRELQRLNSVSNSPIYSNFGQTIVGAASIRAYQDEQRFVTLNDRLTDVNQQAYFAFTSTNRWLAVRLETIGTVIVVMASLLTVVSAGSISAALAGLSVSYALSITQGLNWVVRMAGQVETQIVSVERIAEYTESPVEPSGTSAADGPAAPVAKVTPPPEWPSKGAITLKDFKMKYRTSTPYVLHGVSAEVGGGDKVGICGRTGAGKSSLVSALFRLADVQEGTIAIDGIDINDVSLHRLRSSLAIIPQEPFLFKGTLRDNLDPTHATSDAAMWRSLQQVSLEAAVKQQEGGLDAAVAEGGENWSQGQRQLICVARALLRGARIVVLDEASSSVDVTSDSVLQQTIRSEFAQCTVLTIAHRLNTIVDSTRILVLDAGKVAEYDTPATLMGRPDSAFAQLLGQASAAASEGAS